MNYIVFDMEWNQPFTKNHMVTEPIRFSGEIIQIGAVKMNKELQILDKFEIMVRPVYYTKMNPNVKKLTGIDNDDIGQGYSFAEAYRKFIDFCGDEFCLLSWGGDDIRVLSSNMTIHGISTDNFPASYNLQRIFGKQIAKTNKQISLEDAMETLGEPPYCAHNALSDAMSAALVFKHLDISQEKMTVRQGKTKKRSQEKNKAKTQKATDTKIKYKNKKFAVLGDSISTLEGISIPEEAAFYEGIHKLEADVLAVSDTWWGRVIDSLGGVLLVNNSISGSMVSKHPDCMIESYGCSDERTSSLSRSGEAPDVIMVFMGLNDWGYGVKLESMNKGEDGDLSVFSVAYGTMLEKLKSNYPDSEIWCFTLPVSTCTRKTNFSFPYLKGGRHIAEYCGVIRFCAKKNKCRVIELYRPNAPCDTIDGFHPNSDGMKTIADSVIGQL